MEPARSIGRLGWYERQLIESHAWLLTCFLCGLGGVAMKAAERLSYRSTCATCKTYAAFNVIGGYPKMSVRCRKCSHEWVLG